MFVQGRWVPAGRCPSSPSPASCRGPAAPARKPETGRASPSSPRHCSRCSGRLPGRGFASFHPVRGPFSKRSPHGSLQQAPVCSPTAPTGAARSSSQSRKAHILGKGLGPGKQDANHPLSGIKSYFKQTFTKQSLSKNSSESFGDRGQWWEELRNVFWVFDEERRQQPGSRSFSTKLCSPPTSSFIYIQCVPRLPGRESRVFQPVSRPASLLPVSQGNNLEG